MINMEDKDIKLQFINIKDDKVLLSDINNSLPTIYIKESFYSDENIEYYLSMYLNTKINSIKNIKDNYFIFDIENTIKDYSYKEINNIEDEIIRSVINEI